MKKAILTAAMALAMMAPAGARAEPPITLVLAGGPGSNAISIGLSPDGRSYVIDSNGALDIGSPVCSNPPGNPNELVCQAMQVAAVEVNAGGGDDTIAVSRAVPIPTTLRGGSGNDHLSGGGAADRITGGAGDDRLVGRAGDDALYGGEGADTLVGCSGDDILRGGPGVDVLLGGSGVNDVAQ
jgi:Ca2+-binding RTX toxin-like protein